MALGGGTMGVTTSEQTNLHTDSLSNTLNTNKSVPTSYINFLIFQSCFQENESGFDFKHDTVTVAVLIM